MKVLVKTIICSILCLGFSESLMAQRSEKGGYPSVSSRVLHGYMFLQVDGVEYKISKIKLFSHFLLRYHVPTKSVYVFYGFRPGITDRVLVIRKVIQKTYNSSTPSTSFYLEPPFRFASSLIGRDRIPIFGSFRHGNITFAPLSAKLLRVLQGNDKEDDLFVSSKASNSEKFIRSQDFIEISNIPTVKKVDAYLPGGMGDIDTVDCIPTNDNTCSPMPKGVREIPDVLGDVAIAPQDNHTAWSEESNHSTTNNNSQTVVRYGLRRVLIVPEND